MSSLSRSCCRGFTLSVLGKLDLELLCQGRWGSSTPQKSPSGPFWTTSWLSFRPTECTPLSVCSLFFLLPQATLFKLHLCHALKTLQDFQFSASEEQEYYWQAACRSEHHSGGHRSSVPLGHGLTGTRTGSF